MLTKFIDFYYDTAARAKKFIFNYFINKPEKNLVENNIFLLGEHIIFSLIGFGFFWREPWFYDITMMWGQNLNIKIFIYYLLYITRYIVQTKMLTGKEKDYQTMMTHHLSTISLLCLSFLHYHRIGVIIAFMHDLVDLFFLPAKICHKFYETRKIRLLNFFSYVFFSVFLTVFFITRIIINFKIIKHIIDEKIYDGKDIIILESDYYPEGYFLFTLLFVNLGIQIFWQILVIRFAYNLSLGEKPKDEKGNEYFKKKT